jgi:hypothetical protein
MIKKIKKLAKKNSTAKKTGKTTGSKSPSKKRSSRKKTDPEDFYSMVEKKAYELYEKRGHSHGKDIADWLEAERLVKSSVK